MPKIRECIVFYVYVERWFWKALEDGLNLTVLNLWADATTKEQKVQGTCFGWPTLHCPLLTQGEGNQEGECWKAVPTLFSNP